jgi:UDP-N-acetylglucosamine 1-carboxyvinyltransferase
MARLIVRGGKRLSGEYRAPGNKNAALPMLAAAVLTDQPVILRDLPLIEDVRSMLALLESLGVSVRLEGHRVELCARGMRRRSLSRQMCSAVRASILLAGPMAARHGAVTLYPPGGDVIGRRRLDTHFDGLRQLGIAVQGADRYVFRRQSLRGARILLDEASVTATENLVMAAVLAEGGTTLYNAACEPHVQDLCRMLNAMGARIAGIGSNRLEIEGVAALGGADCRIGPDMIDAVSFLAAAALTGGELTITDAPHHLYEASARAFGKLGVHWQESAGTLKLPARQKLVVRNDFGAAIPKIEDGIWPGFPSDLMSVAIVVATQAKGTVLFFEKLFESRMVFVDRLIDMGARIVRCDPHRVMVAGPAALRKTHLTSPDIRAGMAMVLAALVARGESVIDNAQTIDRGYENIEGRLRRLGADIRREE